MHEVKEKTLYLYSCGGAEGPAVINMVTEMRHKRLRREHTINVGVGGVCLFTFFFSFC